MKSIGDIMQGMDHGKPERDQVQKFMSSFMETQESGTLQTYPKSIPHSPLQIHLTNFLENELKDWSKEGNFELSDYEAGKKKAYRDILEEIKHFKP